MEKDNANEIMNNMQQSLPNSATPPKTNSNTKIEKGAYIAYLVGFIDLLAVGMFIPLFPKYARQMNISAVNIGLFGSIYGFLQFVSSPVIGGWSDKFGKASVLTKCLVLSSIGYFILGTTNAVWLVFVSRVFAGCFKHTQSLTKAYLTDVTPHEKHREVFGFHSSISNLGMIVGPTLGGIVAEYEGGFHMATQTGAALFVVQAFIVHFALTNSHPSQSHIQTQNSPKDNDIWDNLKRIFKKPTLREVFIIQFLISASSLLFRENASLLLHIRYQTSSRNIGFMISFANFISSISGFFVARIAKFYGNDDWRILMHCTIVHIVGILSSTFAPEFWMYNSCLVPYKLSQSVSRVAILNVMVENADGMASGELMGSSQSIFAISRIMAPFICGLLQEISVLVPGCLAGVLGILMIPSIYKCRKVKVM